MTTFGGNMVADNRKMMGVYISPPPPSKWHLAIDRAKDVAIWVVVLAMLGFGMALNTQAASNGFMMGLVAGIANR